MDILFAYLQNNDNSTNIISKISKYRSMNIFEETFQRIVKTYPQLTLFVLENSTMEFKTIEQNRLSFSKDLYAASNYLYQKHMKIITIIFGKNNSYRIRK